MLSAQLRDFIRMRFQPLSSDYWPVDVRLPLLRLAAACVAAPAALSLAIALLAALIAFADGAAAAASYGVETFSIMFHGFYSLVFAPAAPVGVVLWSLRLRSRRSFVAGGIVSGLAGSAVAADSLGYASADLVLAVIILHVALMVTIRAFAGVSSENRDP